MISNRNLLIIIAIGILLLSIALGSKSKNEHFYSYYKDRQKVGTGQDDRGAQPRSSWKYGGLNYETCYNTATRSGNTIPRKSQFFCDFGQEGEIVPYSGTYPIDFTNYEVYYQKIVKGKRLQGTHQVGGGSITFDEYGRPIGQIMTLQQSKEVCDSLKDKCAGFILQSSENRDRNVGTYFVATLQPGFEDPNTYDHIFLAPDERQAEKASLTSYQNYTSYVKKDPNYTEKPMTQLSIPGQQFEQRNCSIEQNPEYDLEYMSGTLDDCKARCAIANNCTGFNRTANVPDNQVAACQLKKVSFNTTQTKCPSGYNLNKNDNTCTTGWSWACGQDCAYNKCLAEGGSWIPLNYNVSPYTCRPNPSRSTPVCNTNTPGLVSFEKK